MLLCVTAAVSSQYELSAKTDLEMSDLSKPRDNFNKVKRMVSRSTRWGKRSEDLVEGEHWQWKKTKSSRPFRMGKRLVSNILRKKSGPFKMGI